MTQSCPNTPDGIIGYARRLTATVGHGHFRAQYGTVGQVDSLTYEGTVESDGRLSIFASGLTGVSATSVGHPPAGSPFGYTATGRLDDTSGTATKNEGRVCNFTFVKQ